MHDLVGAWPSFSTMCFPQSMWGLQDLWVRQLCPTTHVRKARCMKWLLGTDLGNLSWICLSHKESTRISQFWVSMCKSHPNTCRSPAPYSNWQGTGRQSMIRISIWVPWCESESKIGQVKRGGSRKEGCSHLVASTFSVCTAGLAAVLSHKCASHFLLKEPNCARQSLASTESVRRVAGAWCFHPGHHANVVTPLWLTPCFNFKPARYKLPALYCQQVRHRAKFAKSLFGIWPWRIFLC